MANTPSDQQDQTGNTPQDPNASGTPPGPDPNAPGTPPQQPPDPGSAQPSVDTKNAGFLGTLFGNLFSGIANDWQKSRELDRELKRAKALVEESNKPLPSDSGTSGDDDNGEQSPDLLQQERNKRIRMISDFTDVKESLDHRVKRYVASFACFLVPWLMVGFLTSDVGEYFAGQPFNSTDFQVMGIFGITALLEVVIAVVTNAWGNTVHDANATDVAADKGKLRERGRTQFTAWAVLSLVSGFALFMFLMQQSADNAAIATGTLTHAQITAGLHAVVNYSISPATINVILRVVGTLAIDPACVFAVHTTTMNLDQFLKQQSQVTTAITQISDAFDKQQEAAARADMRRKENERFLELKSGMDTVNASMMSKMGDKLLQMSDTMFEQMKLPNGKTVDADDEDEGRRVRRLRP